MASKQQHPLTSPHSSPPRIAIKLTPDAHKLQQQEGKHITKLVTKTDSGLGLKHEIKPLITSQPSDAVAQLVTRAAQLDPTYKPVNFNAWYQVEFDPEQLKSIKDDGSEGHEIRNELQRHAHRLHGEDDVESAHLVGTVCPLPVVNWKDNPRAQFEGYIDKAPGGIDAKFAWGFPGGDGAGTNVVDLERGWDLNHEDLVSTSNPRILIARFLTIRVNFCC
jgi:serine protease